MYKRRWPINTSFSWIRGAARVSIPSSRLLWIIVLEGIFLMLGLWAVLTLRLPGDYGDLEIGKPSSFTIQAPHSVDFTSKVRTEELRNQAEKRPENLVYDTDLSIPTEQRAQLNGLLNTINHTLTDPTLEREKLYQSLIDTPSASVEISDEIARTIISLSEAEWNAVKSRALTLYDRALAEHNYELNEEAVRNLQNRSLPYWIFSSQLSQSQKDLLLFFTTSFLRVNRVLDEAATEQKKNEAREAVEPVQISVQQGEKIVGVGEIVSPEMIEKLEETGALPKPLSWQGVISRGILSVILALTFIAYLFFCQNSIVRQPRPMFVIIILQLIVLLGARLLLPFWNGHEYAFPMATIALVLAVVFNGQLALASVVLLSVVVGIMESESLQLATTMLLGSAAAVFVLRGTDRMLAFLLAGISVVTVTAITQLAFWIVSPNASTDNILSTVMSTVWFSAMHGGLAAILSLGSFNAVSRIAGVITPLQLMELAHPAQPLLRKLMQEAPGTYYHSVAVGNLAEAAAEEIGADALLLRVAAYYHDIGKTVRPYFFTDNQMGRENVHNDLDPRTSAQIIVDHVREGVKMARGARLPQPIIDFIATHHGTHLIKHFYQLALQHEDTVDIEDFRYPGPKPSTREQGILMLADSVEATVRSKAQNGKLFPNHSEADSRTNGNVRLLEELVGSIIDERVRDGQLDNTPLTLHDLTLIRKTFVINLQSIYHPRVDYAPQLVR